MIQCYDYPVLTVAQPCAVLCSITTNYKIVSSFMIPCFDILIGCNSALIWIRLHLDSVKIRIWWDPKSLDPVKIPDPLDPTVMDPVRFRIRPDPKIWDPVQIYFPDSFPKYLQTSLLSNFTPHNISAISRLCSSTPLFRPI